MKKNKCKICEENNSENFYKGVKSLCKKHYKEQASKWAKNNLIHYRVISAKNRAKYKGLEFNIELKDILDLLEKQNYCCYYSGVKFDNDKEDYTMSIDRIDSLKGYTKDNIILVLSCVNYMKNNMKEEIFLDIVNKIFINML